MHTIFEVKRHPNRRHGVRTSPQTSQAKNKIANLLMPLAWIPYLKLLKKYGKP
jgi:hypothetical protein